MQIILHQAAVLLAAQGQRGEANNGIHRRADIVAHIGQKGALGLVGCLCHMQRILRRHAQLHQLLVGLLLHFNHLAIAPCPYQANQCQGVQGHQHNRKYRQHLQRGLHHGNGAHRHKLRRNHQHYGHVIILQGIQAVIILLVIENNIGSSNTSFLQGTLHIRKAPATQIGTIFQGLIHIASTDKILRIGIIIGQGTIFVDNIGSGMTAVGFGGVILFNRGNFLQQHHMGELQMLTLADGAGQLLAKC